MTKFKVLENVEVIVSQSPHFGQKGKVVYLLDTGNYLVQMNGCLIEAADYVLRSLDNEQNPPFNLEQFKSGIPAITCDGRTAAFIRQQDNSILVDIEGTERWLYAGGTNFKVFKNEPTDLVSMQVTQSTPEQTIPAQEPAKSIDEKRYEWIKAYQISKVTILQFEKEVHSCKSSEELNKVVDKYSALITFNKP